MPRGQITSLTKANKTSESLRTTVPSSVIKQFDLKEGDKLKWWLESDKRGNILIRIDPVRRESTEKMG
jgi:antitoxin component of MazEF toxin-antitoxin module